MRAFATARSWILASALLTVALLPGSVKAQPGIDPTWDHYKVYRVQPPITDGRPVILTDQFNTQNHVVQVLEEFMNPTEKQVPGLPPFLINRPELHYTWWRISPSPWNENVLAINQFGNQTLHVSEAVYLLNPALKNAPIPNPPLPLANHYKCYACQGQPVNRPVLLTDQFGVWQAQATIPLFLCNPTEKRVQDATGQHIYPIVDPRQHLVCYDLQPQDPRIFTGSVSDQFITNRQLEMSPGHMLCVPSLKERPTGTNLGTWGSLKVLYR